jgi:hypothetical protein
MELALVVSDHKGLDHAGRIGELMVPDEPDCEPWEKVFGFPWGG